MTIKEYYEILKKMWSKIDQNNLEQIKAYNEFKSQLRKEIEDEKI